MAIVTRTAPMGNLAARPETGPMSRDVSAARCIANAFACSLLLFAAGILALHPDWIDRPLAKAVNSLTRDHEFANELAFGIAYPTLQGVIVVSLLWCCWFSGVKDSQARLVSGIFAAVLAALVAGLLQHALPTSSKPILDPLLALDPPAILGDVDSLREASFSNLHTFPSERAAMFGGLAIAILLVQRKLGLLALGCTIVPELSRIYLGLHYPADIVGSFALAGAMVWVAQIPQISKLGLLFVRWEGTSPSTFYMCAFLASYQMTTAFEGLRDFAALFVR
jgi:membrane-associated phospholipid phosphatase